MEKQATAVDSNAMEWNERPSARLGLSCFKKLLVVDDDTGMQVNITKYPAGYVTPRHDHPCAHGMFVLEGTLHTSDGDYGPGSFVWFPEGSVAEHGAVDADVTVLFITNKEFAIRYMD